MDEKLKALNDITEKMLSGIDENSDHLLYKDDKFVKLREQMDKLREAASERLYDLSSDDEDKKKNKAEIKALEEEIKRADKFCEFLSYVEETKNAMNALNQEDVSADEKKQAEKKAFDFMVKMKMAVADIRNRSFFSSVADAIDPDKLSKIFTDDKSMSKINQKDKYLDAMSKFYSNLDEEKRTTARRALQNGTVQQRVKINYNSSAKEDDPKKYSSEVTGKTGEELDDIKKIVATKRIQHILEVYENAQRYWLGSTLSDEEEKASRRAFMECYEDELSGLYNALNVNSSADQDKLKTGISEYLNKNGLESIMRDYHDMMCDRKIEAGKVIEADKDPWHYIYSGMSEEEKSFRAKPVKSQVYDNPHMNIDPDKQKEPSQVAGLKEFHRWIYRNCDNKAALGKKASLLFGANGSARGYLEDFMKAPYDQQIKTLYMLEHKTRRREQPPTDDEIKDYVPNLDKLKDVMVSTKWKVWQRLNGKKHRWNKIKECMDRLTVTHKAPEKGKEGFNYDNIMGTVTPIYKGSTYINEKLMGNETSALGRGIGGFHTLLTMAKTLIGLKKSVPKMNSENRTTELGNIEMATNLNNALGLTSGGAGLVEVGQRIAAGKMDVKKFSSGFGDYSKFSGKIVGTASTIINGAKIYDLWRKNKKYGKELGELLKKSDYENVKDKDKKEILRKIKRHGNAIKELNKTKAIMTGINSVSGVGNNISSWVGNCTLGTAAGGVGVAAVPISMLVNNIYERNAYRSVIDAELFENDKEKNAEIDKVKATINKKLNRLPKNDKNDKLRTRLEKVRDDNKRVLNILRRNVARTNKCVNEKQLQNKLLRDIGKDIYQMFKDSQKPDSEFKDREIKDILASGSESLRHLIGGDAPKSLDTDKIEKMDKAEAEMAQKKLDEINVGRILKGV